MSRTRRKPSSPAEILAKAAALRVLAFASVDLQLEAANLNNQEGVDITRKGDKNRDGKRAKDNQIMRLDAFHQLRDSLCDGGYDAVRKFETQLTIRRGEHDRGRNLDRVDCETGGDRTDAMLAAGKHVDAIIVKMGPRAAWLICELLDPSAATRLKATTWRKIVYHVTGAENPVAQTERVRAAVEELTHAYQGSGETRKVMA